MLRLLIPSKLRSLSVEPSFSLHGRYLVAFFSAGAEISGRSRLNRLVAWRLRDGRRTLSRAFPKMPLSSDAPAGARQPLNGFRFIAKGTKGRASVVAFFRRALVSYDLETGKVLGSLAVNGSIDAWPAFAASTDGRLMTALTRYDEQLSLLSPWTGKVIKRLRLPRCAKASGVCGNGAYVIAFTKTSLFASTGLGAIWRRGSWRRLTVVDDQAAVSGGKLAPDYQVRGHLVSLRSKRGELIRWDLRTGKRSVKAQAP